MSMMDKMMEFMMGRMSKEEKEAMMGRMMDKFFADMISEDKQKMMAEMMPKIDGRHEYDGDDAKNDDEHDGWR